jgi:hypothetical protein
MLSLIVKGSDIKNMRSTNFDEINGVMLDTGDVSLFLSYEVVDRLVDFQKDMLTFVSQVDSERMLVELKALMDRTTSVTVQDRAFLLRCQEDLRRKTDFSGPQKKTLKIIFEKYIGSKESFTEEDSIPF